MYKNDERVLCFHGPLLYEAKVRWTDAAVLDVSPVDALQILKNKPSPSSEEDKKPSRSAKDLLYLVHYKGWKHT